MHAEDANGVRTITFDRPEVKNAFTMGVASELADRIEETDPEEHSAVVLTGEGDAFSAGGDIQSMADREMPPREAYETIQETFGRLAETMLSSPVPIVAKVNGDAVGAGLAIVAAADFAYAVDTARFSAAFVKVGLVPDTAATIMLPRIVGLRTAKELAFTGDLVTAEEAADKDILNEAVPEGDLDATVDDLLDTLRNRPTRTIGMTKQAMHANLGPWRDWLDTELLVQSQAYVTPEHKEGVSAFLEGRPPEF